MGFVKREDAKRYILQDGDTLQKIAERETAAGNEITWQEIAKFNWGTANEDDINEYLRDELGCHKRDDMNNFVISSDDEPERDLLIPLRFKKTGLALKKIYTLRVRKKVSPPQFLQCCLIPGITFEFNKSFVRPSVVDHIKKLEEAVAQYPEAKIMIFGHTDKVGSDSINKQLSERRAMSVYAFITDDAETWEMLYNKEDWGTRVIQEILKDFGGEFDPGPVDGIYGPKTKEAVRKYQGARGLTVDGIAGPNTRNKMFTEYMTTKHDIKLQPDQFMDTKHMGCGEFNPVKATEAAHEPNRRVTFYLFNRDRLPRLTCKEGDMTPCIRQMDPPAPRWREDFRCSFYDSIAKRCPYEGILPEGKSMFILEISEDVKFPDDAILVVTGLEQPFSIPVRENFDETLGCYTFHLGPTVPGSLCTAKIQTPLRSDVIFKNEDLHAFVERAFQPESQPPIPVYISEDMISHLSPDEDESNDETDPEEMDGEWPLPYEGANIEAETEDEPGIELPFYSTFSTEGDN